VNYLKTPNGGAAYARNRGIEQARGEYIAFLDSDDVWYANKIELQLARYAEKPDAGLICGSCCYIDMEGNEILVPTISPASISNEELEIFPLIPGATSNVLIRKTVIEDVGAFDETLLRSQDRELWMRISRKYPVYGIRNITCKTRIHDTPRHKINLDVIKQCRRKINKTIKNRNTRRKADAWLYFRLSGMHMKQGEVLSAWFYLFRSVLAYPFRIHERLRRSGNAVEILLPKPIYNGLSGLRNMFR
jgi:glycosyltransferase involved in cell wall biosynthesis